MRGLRRLVVVGLGIAAVATMTTCQASLARGSGHVVSESRQVSGFDRVSLGGIGNLIITQGSQEALTIDAEDNVLPHITTAVSGGQLSISYDLHGLNWVQPTKPIDFHLTVINLSEVDLGGSGTITTSGLRGGSLAVKIGGSGNATLSGLALTALNVDVTGNGAVAAAGTADSQRLRITGNGSYRAPELASQTAQITIAGSGSTVVNAARMLDVTITGNGSVQYLGDPAITQHILGNGKVSRAS